MADVCDLCEGNECWYCYGMCNFDLKEEISVAALAAIIKEIRNMDWYGSAETDQYVAQVLRKYLHIYPKEAH